MSIPKLIQSGTTLTSGPTPCKTNIATPFARIDAQANQIAQKIDSLQRLDISTNKYKRALNKLPAVRKKVEGTFTQRLNALKTKP